MRNRQLQIGLSIMAIAITAAAIYFLRVDGNRETNITNQKQSTSQENKETVSNLADCDGNPTPSQTEGPYYKGGSSQKSSLVSDVNQGQKLTVTGYVFDKDCNPISGAWLDFWQADANGDYDNQTYKLRGNQFTSDKGQYRLETIIPAAYESRPPHIHVKVRSGNGPILTSQLYFPNQEFNKTDSIFNEDLIMKIEEGQNETLAHFNFVIP